VTVALDAVVGNGKVLYVHNTSKRRSSSYDFAIASIIEGKERKRQNNSCLAYVCFDPLFDPHI
jgi:hypothetical protein